MGNPEHVKSILGRVMKIMEVAKAKRELNMCPTCDKPIAEDEFFRDELSRKEFKITGMCQKCQDETFRKEE